MENYNIACCLSCAIQSRQTLWLHARWSGLIHTPNSFSFLLKCGTELNSKTFTFWVKRTLKTHKSVSCGYEAALFKSFRADNLAQPTIWEKGLSDTCKLSASPFNLMQYPWMHVQLCVCVCVHADYNTLSFNFSCCICSYLETFFA